MKDEGATNLCEVDEINEVYTNANCQVMLKMYQTLPISR